MTADADRRAERLQALGQLACGLAHDFNNLLTAIDGAAESVAAHTGLPDEAVADLAVIRDSAGRGAAMVRQLLAFGQDQPPQSRLVKLDDFVAGVAALLRRLLGGRIALELALWLPDGQIRADPARLDQGLVNLAVNARDAMPDGGRLTIRTGQIGHYATIEVQDTGRGIPSDVLPRIFEPFFTTRQDSGGTGLGLSTVRDIVREFGGVLEVESTVGVGTLLRVCLPLAPDRAAMPLQPGRAAARAAPARRPEPGDTLLIVDDEDPVRRLAERALSRAGWQVIAADSGEAAFAELARRPDVRLAGLVVDLAMPGLDGAQVMQAVRASTGRPMLPVLLVSGYGGAALRQALAGQGGVAVLAKPYTLAELVDAVAEMTRPVDFNPADL